MFGAKLRKFANSMLLEGPGRRRPLAQWPRALAESGERIAARVHRARGNAERNGAILNHIVGIERWCQRRLRVFLGQPPVRDEYDGYRPQSSLALAEQLAAFRAARGETIALVEEILATPFEALPETVEHNQHGALSIYAWLRYLELHANWEARRIR